MEYDMTHDELLARLDERQQAMDSKIDEILEQTKKTNGRLLKAESEIDDMQVWRGEIKGAFKTMIILFTALGAVITWIISTI